MLRSLPIVENVIVKSVKEVTTSWLKRSRILTKTSECLVTAVEKIQKGAIRTAVRLKANERLVNRLKKFADFNVRLAQRLELASKMAKFMAEHAVKASRYAAELLFAASITFAKCQYSKMKDYFYPPKKTESVTEYFKRKIPLVYYVLVLSIKLLRWLMSFFIKHLRSTCGLLRQVLNKTKSCLTQRK